MSDAAAPNADWYPDPSGRYQFRYWDGQEWTGHVSTEGETAWDPPEGEEEATAEAVQQEAVAEPAVEPAVAEAAAVETAAVDEEWAPGEADDTNQVAIQESGVADDTAAWLGQVADQVEPRLTRINATWAHGAQAEAARACAFGLLMGHLATLHPHMRDEIGQVAEAHPSFSTLDAGSRLQTLEQIAGDAGRSAAWLGPLIEVEDPDRVAMLFD